MARKSYADRDVLDKLGVRAGMRIRLVGPVSEDLAERIAGVDDVEVERQEEPLHGEPSEEPLEANLVLWRLNDPAHARGGFARLRRTIVPDGAIWVLTSKRGADDHIRQETLIPIGKSTGLIDNKVCSIDDRTSAIRFVIPVSQRERPGPERG